MFGVDRIEDPWPEKWEDGTLLSTEELAEVAAQEALGRAYEEAMGGPFCGGIVDRRAPDPEDVGPAAAAELERRGL